MKANKKSITTYNLTVLKAYSDFTMMLGGKSTSVGYLELIAEFLPNLGTKDP